MAALATKDKDLRKLRRLIAQADEELSTIPNPDFLIIRSRELLSSALSLTDVMANRPPEAVALGAIGGKKTAARGPEYYARIASMRKTRAGGRPRKQEG
jgi:hypothetical protein